MTNDNVAGWGISLVGGAFIFVSSFVTITVWEIERTHDELVVSEFSAAVSLATDLARAADNAYIDAAVAADAQSALVEYAEAVSEQELTQLTGLPGYQGASGTADAIVALDKLQRSLDVIGTSGSAPTSVEEGLWESWRSLEDNRVQRLALRSPLPPVVLTVIVVAAICTLVLVGSYPSGTDTKLRWMVTVTGGLIVVSILSAVIMLVSPSVKQGGRQAVVQSLLESGDGGSTQLTRPLPR